MASVETAIATWPAAESARFGAPPSGLVAGIVNLAADSYDILEVELDRRTGTPVRLGRLGYVRRDLDPVSLVEEYLATHDADIRAIFGLPAGRTLDLSTVLDPEGWFTIVVYGTACNGIPVEADSVRLSVTGVEHPEGPGILQVLDASIQPDIDCRYTTADLLSDADAVDAAAGTAATDLEPGAGSAWLSIDPRVPSGRYVWSVVLPGDPRTHVVDAYSGEGIAVLAPDESAGTILTPVYTGTGDANGAKGLRYAELWDATNWTSGLGRTNVGGGYSIAETGDAYFTFTSALSGGYGGILWNTKHDCDFDPVGHWEPFTPGVTDTPVLSTTRLCLDDMGVLGACTGPDDEPVVGTPSFMGHIYGRLMWERDMFTDMGAELPITYGVFIGGGGGTSSPCGTGGAVTAFLETSPMSDERSSLNWHEGTHAMQYCTHDTVPGSCSALNEGTDRYGLVLGSWKEGTADVMPDIFLDFKWQTYGGSCNGSGVPTAPTTSSGAIRSSATRGAAERANHRPWGHACATRSA